MTTILENGILPFALNSFKKHIHGSYPINHFSLNLFHDGRLVLFNYVGINAACETSNKYINQIYKQVDFVNRGSGWQIADKNGCGCTNFLMLSDFDLPNDWEWKIESLEGLGRLHMWRSTSTC